MMCQMFFCSFVSKYPSRCPFLIILWEVFKNQVSVELCSEGSSAIQQQLSGFMCVQESIHESIKSFIFFYSTLHMPGW